MPKCYECKKCLPTVKALVFHLQIIHKVTCTQKFSCGESNCVGKFDNLKHFKAHLRRVHKFCDSIVPCQNEPEPCTGGNETVQPEEGDAPSDHETIDEAVNHEECEISFEVFQSAIRAQAEAFIAKLYSKPNLPRSHVQSIIEDADVFLGSGYLNLVREKCLKSLNECKADVSVINDLQNMFDVLQDPFSELKTEYHRLKQFKLSGDYIPPVSYTLGKELLTKRTEKGQIGEWADVEAQFFPLRNTFKKILELPNCLDDILSYIETLKTEIDTISNFIQGDLWKSKIEHFTDDDIVLPLFIFFDDFECNNALGPNSGKLGAVYASIPCLPPECRAALQNIFLALLFNSKDREEFGNENILKPLLKELQYLEETGISVQTKNGVKKVNFVLGLVIGDNLGVHQICGFVECFKANYPCRFCKASKEQIATMTKVNNRLLRNRNNYDADLVINDVSRTGVNSRCEFNRLPSFHVTSNYAVDPMHDLAEGTIKYVMGFIVSDFVRKNYISLYDLNNRIRMFDFGPEVSNKPNVISEDHLKKQKVKMTASQSFCFVRHFGVMVGDLVPHDDKSWRLYLALMRIVDIALAKTVPKTTFITFPVLVEELIVLYKSLRNTIKPKFHYLLHYAIVFKMCGPVAHLSCMRFEGKHRQLKQTAVTNMSRINLEYSVGIKHQLKLCSRFKARESIIPGIESGSASEISLKDHEYYLDIFPTLPQSLKDVDITFTPKWVNFKGTRYSPSMVLATGRDDTLWWPTFGKIQFILIENSSPIFVCTKLENIGFSKHFHGYEVFETNNWFCVPVEGLLDPLPVYYVRAVNGENFVILRYVI